MDGNFLLAIVAFVYLLPVIIAARRHHPQLAPIAIITIALGFTLIGWIVGLAWAVSAIKRDPRPQPGEKNFKLSPLAQAYLKSQTHDEISD